MILKRSKVRVRLVNNLFRHHELARPVVPTENRKLALAVVPRERRAPCQNRTTLPVNPGEVDRQGFSWRLRAQGGRGKRMPMNSLPIAFSTLAFPEATLAEATSLGRSLGYAGVELRLIDGQLIDFSMPAAERLRVKQTVAAARLPIVIVGSSILLTAVNADHELRQFLELANEWESPLIRVYGGPLAEESMARRRQIEAAAGVLQRAVPHAERLGVAVAIETHDAFSASSVVAELLAMVDSRWIGAVWDTHHPHRMGESPAEVYGRIGPRVLHVQVKDARRSAGHKGGWELVLLGEGEVPVREIIGLLAAGGYGGWISVEWEKYWRPEIGEPEIALPQHLKLLEEWAKDLAREGDT
jgi:sugar phosphate isomerase/epimerase